VTNDPNLPKYLATDRLFRANLEHYCAKLCWILDKDQRLRPLIWNRAQRHVHKIIEQQKERTGKVRVVILKGRQTGISTYVCARFYHKTTLSPGLGQRTHIQTHEESSTKALYGMVARLHKHMLPDYNLATTAPNSFVFASVDSRYTLSTAKNISGTGRGTTPHNLHCSEFGFWPHADVHMSGIISAVPDTRGSEIIFESTANGASGAFYTMWQMAEAGESEYEPIFIPWWWIDDFSNHNPPDNYVASEQEEDYGRLRSLNAAQVCWMHYKNINLGGKPGELCPLFRQEYPGDPQEAFQASGQNPFIEPHYVVEAMAASIQPDQYSAHVLGVDPAFGGPDKTRLIDRKGPVAGEIVNETYKVPTGDEMALANYIVRLIDIHQFDRVFIDAGVGGRGIVSRLIELGFGSIVSAVQFGSTPTEPKLYIQKRSEMWGNMRDWFKTPGGVSIPKDPQLHREICGPTFKQDEKHRIQLETKDKIRERLKFSPDGADALALTFAETVVKDTTAAPSWRDDLAGGGDDGDFMTQ